MAIGIDIEKELHSLGLEAKPWNDVLAAVKAKLQPQDWERFSRLHKNFAAYRSESTLASFYGFVFTRGLQIEINKYRYSRLIRILGDLAETIEPGLSILDVGAGAGIIATIALKRFSPKVYAVQDEVAAVRDELKAQGFSVLPHPVPSSAAAAAVPTGPGVSGAAKFPSAGFDLILCADSLGEINADDDGLLAKRASTGKADAAPGLPDEWPEQAPDLLPDLMEERYGFAEKLRAWRPYLASGGRILLWEPFAYPAAMEAVALFLRGSGWDAQVIQREPGRNYLELRSASR